jgi:HEPN superfamily Swt1-like protein
VAANRQVREALLQKTGWDRKALSYHVKQLRNRLPMSTEDAQYVLAHQNRVRELRHLDSATLTRVSEYVSRLNGGAAASSTARTPRARAVPSATNAVVVNVPGFKMQEVPGITVAHAKEAERMANRVYPLLYLFENSARDVITRVLKSAKGDKWWEEIVPDRVQQQAKGNIEREGKEAWHGKRSVDPIDYVDLPQLAVIVTDDNIWPYFRGLFTNRKSWFEGLVQDLNVSRRVAAHMNPLAVDDIQSVEFIFKKWVKQLQAVKDRLP